MGPRSKKFLGLGGVSAVGVFSFLGPKTRPFLAPSLPPLEDRGGGVGARFSKIEQNPMKPKSSSSVSRRA